MRSKIMFFSILCTWLSYSMGTRSIIGLSLDKISRKTSPADSPYGYHFTISYWDAISAREEFRGIILPCDAYKLSSDELAYIIERLGSITKTNPEVTSAGLNEILTKLNDAKKMLYDKKKQYDPFDQT